MRITLIGLFFLAAVSIHASFELDPIAPTDRSFIHVQARELWKDGCLPESPHVGRSGTMIEVAWSTRSVGCPTVLTEWNVEVPIGVLEADVYSVVLKVDGRTIATKKLIVSEVAPAFEISPRIVSTTEPGVVYLHLCEDSAGPQLEPLKVLIDGVEVPSVMSWCWAKVILSPHAAGPVNVKAFVGNRAYEVINGIHYLDTAAAPEPSIYERVLVPITFNGPGAYGTRWVTDAEIVNPSLRRIRFLPDVSRPLTQLESQASMPLSIFGNRPKGILLFVPRAVDVRFGSLVRDERRQETDYGAEVPIVREGDTHWRVILSNVPFDRRFRLQLRVYDIDGLSGTVSVLASREGGSSSLTRLSLEGPCEEDQLPCNSNQPGFGAVDLASVLAGVAGQGPHRVTITADRSSRRLWAFVTVTNNETQRVTVISPQ